mgnify:CR=1 FL=1
MKTSTEIASKLLSEISLESYADYDLPNGRCIWVEEIDDEEYFSPHLLIELRCSEYEWDMPYSEFANRKDPAIVRYILSKDDNVEEVVRVLLMKDAVTPVKDISIEAKTKIDTIGYDIEQLLDMVPENVENKKLSDLFAIFRDVKNVIVAMQDDGTI